MSEESDKEANSEGSETPAEETAPKNSKPAPDEALGEFLKTLSKQASEELKAEVKMTPGGLFVSETQLASVSELFASFLRNAGDSACTDAKAQQRMFGKAPEPRYLIEGKRCMRGQLASYPHSSPQSFSLPTFIGDTLSAKSMLHPRDPGLNSIEGLTNEMSGSSQVLSIEWQRGKLTLGSKLLEQFEAIKENSHRIQKDFKQSSGSRRDLLALMVSKLTRARVPAKGARFIVPSFAHSKSSDYGFLESGHLILVTKSKSQIDKLYERSGRNLGEFIIEELSVLRSARNHKLGKGFRFAGKRDRGLAFLEAGSDRLLLSLPALRDFIDSAQRKRSLVRELPARFTLKDALSQLNELLSKSIWVMESDIPRELRGAHRGKLSYRKAGDWYFVVESGSRLVACAEESLLKERAARGPKKDGDKNRGRNSRQRPKGKSSGRPASKS